MTESQTSTPKDLLKVENLVKYFPIKGGFFQRVVAQVRAVEDVSFTVREGETFGLVGESGCGKTTVGRSILRLTPATSGHVTFDGIDVFKAKGKELKSLRRDMQIIFQDPYASLDPRITIGESVGEGLKFHNIGENSKERHDLVIHYLRKVGLQDYHARRYPHEFSGGQRQRIGIARALALHPRFIMCDEPVSALDVSIQAQVLNILKDLQADMKLTYLFVAHNLSVVEHISDRIGVMYLGKLVELTDRKRLFTNPEHPYTQALLSAIPVPDPKLKRDRVILKGDVPSPLRPPSGCRFHTRCPFVMEKCKVEEPIFKQTEPDHWVACWKVDEEQAKMATPSA